MRKFFSWFGTGSQKNDGSLAETAVPEIPKLEFSNSTFQTKPVTGIEWVDNDGLLRDEGVLFGIAEADYTVKISSIKSAFDKVKSSFVLTRNQLQELIKLTEKEEDHCLENISQAKKELGTIELNSVKGTHHLLPGLFQFLVYGAICFFNYYLLVYWLTPVFPDQLYIPLGLYLFGLLSVFMGKALVYNSNAAIQNPENSSEPKREKWKVILEEMGIPFTVSIFICTLSFRSYPIEWSIAAFTLFFFLFSFSGKGLINISHINYKHLKLQLKHWKMTLAKKKEIKKQIRLLASLEKKKQTLLAELKPPEIRISELDAIFSYKVKVFESEYNLAKEARNELSSKQVASF